MKPRVGISSCLLGEAVRYDGGHKRHSVIVEIIGPKVEWVAVCPEMETGMGVPREAVYLTGDPQVPAMLASETGKNWTLEMLEFSKQKIEQLKLLRLDGFIFKNSSPSCGIDDVKVYRTVYPGDFVSHGQGVFASLFMAHFPALPVTDEGKLSTEEDCDNFLRKISKYRQDRK